MNLSPITHDGNLCVPKATNADADTMEAEQEDSLCHNATAESEQTSARQSRSDAIKKRQ